MNRHLLPPNRTALESALADAMALDADPAVLATLWDADACPAAWLPWLAWALSVEEWESATTEAQQRALIRQSVPRHRHKGVPGSIVDTLDSLGLRARVHDRLDVPHAFEVDIDLSETGLDEATRQRIESAVDHYRNARSFATAIRIAMTSRGVIRIGAAVSLGDELTVYPYTHETLTTSGRARHAGAIHLVDTLTVRSL
ncbi:phage tail protein I [Laribacter hongkongensis]|uniref:phage tail protein I n=1 Tax=Laribacter hongkongensis TaxID=168471 RepID=UPI001EFC4162|nr:phage tail protein I [Laribacter hongkongensis]MCG9077109.1 phage tail protein I [Laribacter hongkongensis]